MNKYEVNFINANPSGFWVYNGASLSCDMCPTDGMAKILMGCDTVQHMSARDVCIMMRNQKKQWREENKRSIPSSPVN